jgi:hypothetical protein
MKKRIIIAILIVAGIHFVVSLGIVCISFVSGMEKFDNPERQFSLFEKASHRLSRVLLQPGLLCWTPWMSKHMPDIVEWGLLFTNSLLWGLVLAIPSCLLGAKRKGVRVTKPSRRRPKGRASGIASGKEYDMV